MELAIAHKEVFIMRNLFVDEVANGAETVEIVIGIICSVGLGAALLTFQDVLRQAITQNGEMVSNLFNTMAANAGSGIAGTTSPGTF